MKTISKSEIENGDSRTKEVGTLTLQRAKEIMKEEGIEYTDEELKEVLQFISKVVFISTANYERLKDKQAEVISINTNTTHEAKSLSLYPREHRRAS